MKLRHRTRALAAVLGLVMVAAACGDDGDDTAAPETPTESTAASTSTSGGEPSADGDLAPQPLAERTTLKVVRSAKIEAFAQMFLAESMGEFDKENIEIEYVDVTTQPDGLVLLNTGRADVMPTSPTAGVLNAINGGSPIRMVAPIFTPNPESKSGLWVTDDLLGDVAPEDFDIAQLKGKTIAVAGGAGTPATYTIRKFLDRGGLTLADVKLTRIASAEQLIALEQGSVDAAYLNDPFWIEAEQGGYAGFVAGAEVGVSLGGFFFGQSLMEGDPAVGDAFIRALARTTREYLQGDYHSDDAVVDALVEVIGVPRENLTRTPSLVFDPDLTIPEGLLADIQEGYIEEGSLGFTEPLPEDQVVDTSFRDRVLGGS
jgi:NitT/TauT family transport system substrate-binding protein